MPDNPNLAVYRVPFTVTLTGAAFILAESLQDALDKAALADIGDYLSVDGEHATIDPEQGELVDFGPIAITDDATTVIVEPKYPVEDHPDYDSFLHEEDTTEGKPEGLRS